MSEGISSLQRSILDKYRTLADCLHELDDTILQLNKDKDTNPEQVLSLLREIEIKIALVSTLMKGSVYSLVLQRSMNQLE
ncbi:HER017Wp [Eremothecium sinecaudum]|uniref:DASH complex subunit DAD3 n=1 Tax=Eremothecium sinecaudum TaxID=45286 RepID=A0A0X8HT05_9SACH|nr:HER017Wp [Eremothecium sinecaudum]AMD21296.1 HER017Wp [Eremothecium sinecaudum]